MKALKKVALVKSNPRDPFSQALALLLREKGAKKLKKKLYDEMVPLIVQVAGRIGAMDYENTISERALPVFAGTISLALMEKTGGVANVCVWAREVKSAGMTVLFRRGFTMVHNLVNLPKEPHDFQIWLMGEYDGPQLYRDKNTAEVLEHYATKRTNGRWSGFESYSDEAAFRLKLQSRFELALFLGRLVKAENAMRSQPELRFDHMVIMCRILLNVFCSGKASAYGDSNLIVEAVEAAHSKKTWWKDADRNRRRFLDSLPFNWCDVWKGAEGDHGEGVYSLIKTLKSVSKAKDGETKKQLQRRLANAVEDIQSQTGLIPESVKEAFARDQEEWERNEQN
jgi:hypothetical protein